VQGLDGAAVLHWAGEPVTLTLVEAEALAELAEGAVPRDQLLAERLWRMGLLEPDQD
jgi:hypothetical protein